MKANSIRIGNHLKWKDNGQEFDVTIGLMLSKHFWKHLEAKDIISIPLTEEWLLKFAFYQKEKSSYWYPKGCWHRYVFHPHAPFRACLNLEPEGCIVPHAQVYYVHQLQNLVHALTGEELIVKDTSCTFEEDTKRAEGMLLPPNKN